VGIVGYFIFGKVGCSQLKTAIVADRIFGNWGKAMADILNTNGT
jgi:hypothetical protein